MKKQKNFNWFFCDFNSGKKLSGSWLVGLGEILNSNKTGQRLSILLIYWFRKKLFFDYH